MPWLLFCSWTFTDCLQRAEFWEVILALQAADGIHFGVDNLRRFVRHAGRLLDCNIGSRLAELVKNG